MVWSVQAHPEFEKWLLSLDSPIRAELFAHTTKMSRNIKQIIKKLPKKEQRYIKQRGAQLVKEELSLQQLRKAREQSQHELAQRLGVKQAEISRLERRTDMYLSTLRSYVEAMGGSLEITARFPDQKTVRITQFGEDASAS